MVTFSSMSASIDMRTIQKALMILGTITACSLILAVLWFLIWLAQEVVQAIAELTHLISATNPLIITGVLVVIAVWLLGKVKAGKSHEKHAA